MILLYATDELNCDNSKSSSFNNMLYSYTHFVGEIHLKFTLWLLSCQITEYKEGVFFLKQKCILLMDISLSLANLSVLNLRKHKCYDQAEI